MLYLDIIHVSLPFPIVISISTYIITLEQLNISFFTYNNLYCAVAQLVQYVTKLTINRCLYYHQNILTNDSDADIIVIRWIFWPNFSDTK